MATLEEFILEQNESSNLDFKAIQYKKEKFEDFLIDIVSMSNADTDAARYIVVGIKSHTNGQKDFLGINEVFVDEATYQQLINENIEPEIKLEYFSLPTNGVVLGVFHLGDCKDPPYMLKKDYGKLKKGDSFIRKGSHQTRLTRRDIDKINLNKNTRQNRLDDIQVNLVINGQKTFDIHASYDFQFPSDEAANRIKNIIKEKQELIKNANNISQLIDVDIPQIGGTPYRNRSIKTLKENLANVKQTYKENDLYYLLEERAFKLNFELYNSGSIYLKDASIEVEIEEANGLIVSNHIINKPDNRSWIEKANRGMMPTLDNMDYPTVVKQNGVYKVLDNIGNLKHLIPSMAFKTPIRFVLSKEYKPEFIVFKVKIFGKTLRKPIEKSIELKVIKS